MSRRVLTSADPAAGPFDEARQAMLRAFAAWVRSGGNLLQATDEIAATARAMGQLMILELPDA